MLSDYAQMSVSDFARMTFSEYGRVQDVYGRQLADKILASCGTSAKLDLKDPAMARWFRDALEQKEILPVECV